ncbi:MAG: RloB-like protein, partial [uncultured Sulfurovum sp.]
MGRRGSSDKFHNKKKELEKKDFKRKVNDRTTVPDLIIACEDSVSSPTYFRVLVNSLIEEKIVTQDSFVIAGHKHTNPMGVLSDLKNYEDENGKIYKDFDHKWIVIDRDRERVNGGGHSKEEFNNALKNAKNNRSNLNVEVAYSNDCFELWYLLHFEYRNTAISRDEIVTQVIKRLQEKE